MFNFFSELKSNYLNKEFISPYNMINLGGKLLYIEGKNNILNLDSENITLSINKNIIEILGEDLSVKELTNDTITVCGKIKEVYCK